MLDDDVTVSLARQMFAFRNASLEDAIWNAIQKFVLRFVGKEIARWPAYLRTQTFVTRLASVGAVLLRVKARTVAPDVLAEIADTPFTNLLA